MHSTPNRRTLKLHARYIITNARSVVNTIVLLNTYDINIFLRAESGKI
jgi:hypothetical protein